MNYTVKTLCIVAVATCLFSCSSKNNTTESKVLSVKTFVCQPYDLPESITYSGKIIARQSADVAFRISGPIADLPVKIGDKLKKGQLIAQMDDRDYKIQLSATQAEFDGIKAQADRVIELYKRGSATESDHDKAISALQQITAKLNAHTNALNDTKLTAPYDAVVEKIMFHNGETVGAGYPVVSLISAGAPIIHIAVPERIKNSLDNLVGIEAEINGQKYRMSVRNCAAKANFNQLYELDLDFQDSGNISYPEPGLVANVTFTMNLDNTSGIAVPVSAIITDSKGQSCVWLYKNNVVRQHYVEIVKIKKNDMAIVYSGLQQGDTIVSAGVSYLHDGQKVKPIPEMSETNIGNIL